MRKLRDAMFIVALFADIAALVYGFCGASTKLTEQSVLFIVGGILGLIILGIIGRRIVK